MRGFLGLTKRNLMIYFKDFGAVVFSLLTSIIVFVLYLVFLKGTFVESIQEVSVGLESFITSNDIEMLVSGILLVGIIGSALITVSYSCLATVIKDRENKIDYDISATPIKRGQIILSYFVAATLSAFIITSIILTAGLLIIAGMGDMNLSAVSILKAYGIVFVGSVSATSIFMVLALFFRSSSASSAFFGMLSAASGFVIGAYIPLSSFSEGIQTVCNLFPATQITVLFRNVLLSGMLEKLNEKIGGVDNGMFVEGMKEAFNFEASIGGNALNPSYMLMYVGIILIISTVAMIAMYNKTYKRK